MNLIAKKELQYSLALLSFGALVYGVVQLYNFIAHKSDKPP